MANVGQNQWADVSFGQTAINAGQTYYLVFTSDNNSLGLAGDLNNGYANGQVYANPGYQGFPQYDYTFHTFRAVPEPATFAVLGIGTIALLRRRKK